ncbi:MAG: hypothetical protein IGS39_04940 [Calothrix sp. C42_A2020_038]|nr:hypothetical protein [Calothrix sp. C42_A2020_038]
MSEQRNNRNNLYKRDFSYLNDLNLSSFWWYGGTEWTSLIKDEITPNPYEALNESKVRHKPIVYSVFAILILLGISLITRISDIYRPVESAQNQLEQKIIFSYEK